jgi:hypothetical protein
MSVSPKTAHMNILALLKVVGEGTPDRGTGVQPRPES